MISFIKRISLYPKKIDIKSILISLIIVNFTFLYHSLNFMWGNHDTPFIKSPIPLSHGFFEGRFTQFAPLFILTNQHLLPILNNLLGFIFLTLGIWLLAKYWKIPKNTLNYTIFITFFCTEPYTISWLYFNLNTISSFLWIFITILGLYFSQFIHKETNKVILSLCSILCFYITLCGYPVIINTIFVCLCGNIVILYTIENKSIKQLWSIHKYTILNIIISLILYKLTLSIFHHNNVYNLETSPLFNLPQKLISIINIAFNQLLITQPFMGSIYKITLFIMVITSLVITLIITKNFKKIIISSTLIFITILSTSLTTLIASAPTQYVARIDFYGYGLLYLFFLSLLLLAKYKIGRSIALILITLLIPANIINCYHAQKIWKQGFDAELEILDRTIERIENHPNFNPYHKYRIYQIGEISLRSTYYKEKFDNKEDFMLELSYNPHWQASISLQLYSPFSYISPIATILNTDITADVYDFFINHARVWPDKNSIYIDKNMIIVIYDYIKLQDFKQKIINHVNKNLQR